MTWCVGYISIIPYQVPHYHFGPEPTNYLLSEHKDGFVGISSNWVPIVLCSLPTVFVPLRSFQRKLYIYSILFSGSLGTKQGTNKSSGVIWSTNHIHTNSFLEVHKIKIVTMDVCVSTSNLSLPRIPLNNPTFAYLLRPKTSNKQTKKAKEKTPDR